MRWLACAWLVVVALSAPAFAQQAQPSRLAIDTSASVDTTRDSSGHFTTNVIVDSLISADLGHGFQAMTRPWAQRVGSTGEWNRQVWVAAVRYERTGPVGLRVDGGLIPPPIGLANLTLRPHLNPTIAQPASLFTPLPPLVAAAGPRGNLTGALYPYGGQATVSATHWDVRGAIIDTSPMRARRIFGGFDPANRPPLFTGNPPRFTNVVVGGGVTPFVGFRVGASVTHGGWLRAGENRFVNADRNATVVNVESEFSFLYTKLAGEWVHDAVSTDTGDRAATGWFLQGQQTLAPRWFVAGRVERMSSPAVLATGIIDEHFNGNQLTLGYRITPDLTFRVEHRERQAFAPVPPAYDRSLAASLVWWRRWF
jgi:hypothetical protein